VSCPRGILGQQGTGTHYPHSCTCSVTPLFSGADILSNFFRICRNSIPPPRPPGTDPPATRPPCPPRPPRPPATLPTVLLVLLLLVLLVLLLLLILLLLFRLLVLLLLLLVLMCFFRVWRRALKLSGSGGRSGFLSWHWFDPV